MAVRAWMVMLAAILGGCRSTEQQLQEHPQACRARMDEMQRALDLADRTLKKVTADQEVVVRQLEVQFALSQDLSDSLEKLKQRVLLLEKPRAEKKDP